MKHILVIEDNHNLAYGLRNNLEIEGYQASLCNNGARALAAVEAHRPDAIILDLMLPGLDGFSVLRELRQSGNDTPVLILTARDEEIDKVRGFRFGADQYVTKPFSVLELLARLESLLRRTPAGSAKSETIRFGSVVLKPDAREVLRDGKTVALAPKEFDLLVALANRNGAVARRLDLIREVWGYPGDVLTRTVDTHIAELRRKLEDDPNHPVHILTARKVGYRLRR